MLSIANIKLINSLKYRKYRERHGLYIIEGDKLVSEYLAGGKQLRMLIATDEWIEKKNEALFSTAGEIIHVSEKELGKISHLSTPQAVMAMVEMDSYETDTNALAGKLSIGLDNIQDPGNLGSIIRIAAWFGIENIICSRGTVDVYNPKTIQSTMGALLHVNVIYADLRKLLGQIKMLNIPVYAATLDGDPLDETDNSTDGLLLFGNESRGLSPELLPYVSRSLSIPPFRKAKPGIDSLNVAMSAAVICYAFRRRKK